MRAPRLVAAWLASVLVAPLARADAIDPFSLPVEKITLSNGLTVLLAPDLHARLVSVVVSYGAGSADEPDGLRGLAHMVEHLAGDGGKHTAHALRRLQAAGGCHFNAVTSLDKTSYFESVPPERLETALWLESDRMGYAADAVTEARVDGERATVANEDRDRHLDTALAAVGPFAAREVFPEWHPYAHVADNDGDLRSIGAKDVLAFLRTWYSPSNATLAIAGAFDRDSTVEAVNRYFRSLPGPAVPARPALPEWTTPAVTLVVAASVSYDSVSLAWRTPAYGSKDDTALDLAASALAGSGNARLAVSLISAGLATAVTARQSSARDASVFLVQARVAPGASPESVAAEIQQTIDDLASSATLDETERARRRWRNGTLAGLETPWGRATRLIEIQRIGGPIGPGFDWGLGRYASIEPDDVARAAGTWLARGRRVTTVIYANRTAPTRGVLLDRIEGFR